MVHYLLKKRPEALWVLIYAGEFRRLRAASFFLDAQKEAKEAPRGGLRMGTSCPYSPTPWTPVTGGYPLD